MYRYRPCQISRLNHCHIWVIAITANVELKGNKFIPISSDSVDKKKLGGRKQAKNCGEHVCLVG